MTPEKIQQWAREAGGGFAPSIDSWICDEETLQAFAQLVRNAALEEAAVVSWTHYMDTCKQRKTPAADSEHFIAATIIRKLKS